MTTYDVISADSHVVEPGDLWERYIAPEFREQGPHMIRDGDTDWIVCGETKLGPPFGYSQAGRTEPPPRTFEGGVYPGAYDPNARLEDMRRDGVDAEVVYPSLGLRAFNIPSVPLRRASLEAYNGWAADFSNQQPEKLKCIAMVDVSDPVLAAEALRRGKELGLAGALMTIEAENPDHYGSDAMDPFWAAAEELSMPLSLHILTNERKIQQGAIIEESLQHSFIQRVLATMVIGGVFMRFPDLRVVSAENDCGWAPYFMERMDYITTNKRRRTYQNYAIKDGGLLPSDYLKNNVRFTFQRDASAVYIRGLLGPNSLMWASDYPHNDSTWPNSQQMIDSLFAGVPDDERRRIVAGNAAALYGFE